MRKATLIFYLIVVLTFQSLADNCQTEETGRLTTNCIEWKEDILGYEWVYKDDSQNKYTNFYNITPHDRSYSGWDGTAVGSFDVRNNLPFPITLEITYLVNVDNRDDESEHSQEVRIDPLENKRVEEIHGKGNIALYGFKVVPKSNEVLKAIMEKNVNRICQKFEKETIQLCCINNSKEVGEKYSCESECKSGNVKNGLCDYPESKKNAFLLSALILSGIFVISLVYINFIRNKK